MQGVFAISNGELVEQFPLYLGGIFNSFCFWHCPGQASSFCEWCAGKVIAAVWLRQAGDIWPCRHGLHGVYLAVHEVVMLLNFGEVGGITEARRLE